MEQKADKQSGKRLSLTVKDRDTKAGLELLELCQTITEDGKLTDDEIFSLKDWLDINSEEQLPSITFLSDLIGHILTDGIITDLERRELNKAIEKILPPDLRYLAATKRKLFESEERVKKKVAKATEMENEKERKLEEKRRLRPLCSADFMVAGVQYEDRGDIIEEFVCEDDQVFLVRDRENEYSKHAIEVRVDNGMMIGFVPEADAKRIAPLLDEGAAHKAYVKKLLDRAEPPIPVIVADVYPADTIVTDVVFEKDIVQITAVPLTLEQFQLVGKHQFFFCVGWRL